MEYSNIIEGIFIDRPNRFIANVIIDGKYEKAHVKNTGRCKEVLKKGTKIYLQGSNNPNRKTKYSLISAYKDNTLINIDSQASNEVVYSSILSNKVNEIRDVSLLKREISYNNSRFDLYYEKGQIKGYIEVKGVTLESKGISMFPDAPTKRGTKHVLEITEASKEGYINYLFFLVQMPNVSYFKPNKIMDEKFSTALLMAKDAGVHILAYNSIVTKNEIYLNKNIRVLL